MKAVHINEFSGPSGLEFRDVDDLRAPAGTEILVRVLASGVNRADLLQSKGRYPAPAGYPPRIPGLEFAGVVESTGPETRILNTGDRVFGITAGGAQAEYLLVDETNTAVIPDGVSFTDAAAFPEVFITANDAIFDRAGLNAGETLLVHAVGSGVGLAALQIAKDAGAEVIGTSRTADKLERASLLGMDAGIVVDDPATLAQRVAEITEGRGADVILDLVGGSYLNANLNAVALKGRIVCVGMTGGNTGELDLGLLLRKRASLAGTVLRARTVEEKAAAVESFARRVVPLIASGKAKPNIDRIFAAKDAAPAYEFLASNASFGKVVLDLSD